MDVSKYKYTLGKPIVLVGLMGSGKTTIGSKLANRLDLEFIDIDKKIERYACCSISDVFYYAGEQFFRKTEKRFIEEYLHKGNCVISTGGESSFINKEIRKMIKEKAISIWLRAEYSVLLDRVSRRKDRPLLDDHNLQETLSDLIKERYPIYAKADIAIDSTDKKHNLVVDLIVEKLSQFKSE